MVSLTSGYDEDFERLMNVSNVVVIEMKDRFEVTFSYRDQCHDARSRAYGFVKQHPPLDLITDDGFKTMENHYVVRGPGGILYAVSSDDLEVIDNNE